MTRVVLSIALCVLTLAVGMWTCVVASYNHERAAALARLQRGLEMRRTANAQLESMAAAHVWGGAAPVEGPSDFEPAFEGPAVEVRP